MSKATQSSTTSAHRDTESALMPAPVKITTRLAERSTFAAAWRSIAVLRAATEQDGICCACPLHTSGAGWYGQFQLAVAVASGLRSRGRRVYARLGVQDENHILRAVVSRQVPGPARMSACVVSVRVAPTIFQSQLHCASSIMIACIHA